MDKWFCLEHPAEKSAHRSIRRVLVLIPSGFRLRVTRGITLNSGIRMRSAGITSSRQPSCPAAYNSVYRMVISRRYALSIEILESLYLKDCLSYRADRVGQ